MIRGITLGAFEGVRAAADAFSSFADGVLSRNEDRGRDRSVRDLLTDLPGDVASGFSDALDDLIDVPARASDRYSRTYREGEDSDRRRSRTRDDDWEDRDRSRERDRDVRSESDRSTHAEARAEDSEEDTTRTAEFSVRAETTRESNT
jgi:hypothetical protein